ncbi:MAG: helix-turn-helix domain-containing protein [Prevotellaceae bacterium]|jgi:transcriptional regulator with XRE-family HTH domain|nr:helix-turn-helix domain-containing protein [Prevotellaceae bacterium]
MKSDKIHIGSLIRQKVKEKSLSVTQFAEFINLSRGAVYNIYESTSIDINLLREISDVLDYDFIEKHYAKKTNMDSDYAIITFLDGNAIPEALPENSILLKRTNKN